MKNFVNAGIILFICGSTANAELIITMSDATVTAGQSSFIDVFVSSDVISTDPDDADVFQNYFLDFITSTPGFFQESAIPAPQLTATSPDYIFLGNSSEEDLGLGIDFVSNDAFSSVITVADDTFDFNNRELLEADGDFLLARLNFIAPASGTFDIELDTLTSGFFDFDNDESALIDIAGSDLTATITAIAAIPEPSSPVVFILGAMFFGFRRSRICSAP